MTDNKTRTFYRTVIEIEVLSNELYDPTGIGQVAYDIVDGDCSGEWKVVRSEEVTPERMSELLIAQGSDPAYLLGEDYEEEEELEEDTSYDV